MSQVWGRVNRRTDARILGNTDEKKKSMENKQQANNERTVDYLNDSHLVCENILVLASLLDQVVVRPETIHELFH